MLLTDSTLWLPVEMEWLRLSLWGYQNPGSALTTPVTITAVPFDLPSVFCLAFSQTVAPTAKPT